MSDEYYNLTCTFCGESYDVHDDTCNECGERTPGYVNTRRVLIPAEVAVFSERYIAARDSVKRRKLESAADRLETAVKKDGKAVINTNLDFLWEWLIKGSVTYDSYKQQVLNGLRKRASFANDVRRSAVDDYLFGSVPDIVYAALSIDETGMRSYGDITVVLKTKSIASRTSALEMNSFQFTDMAADAGWNVKKPLPPGYLSSWANKHKLALIKLSKHLKKGLKHNNLCRLVLESSGNRATDRFIELYIHGSIMATVVEKLRVPKTIVKGLDATNLNRLQELKRKYVVEEF